MQQFRNWHVVRSGPAMTITGVRAATGVVEKIVNIRRVHVTPKGKIVATHNNGETYHLSAEGME